ncbi:hypothetical protein GCM10023185_46530 [Hymenobacter saemangeumensis]|uniref:J domain-containing protein n=1 Tax=Hymenobacter saemangeumensis TaxID=1084522 RepID=A0ABP8ISY2_9BACT
MSKQDSAHPDPIQVPATTGQQSPGTPAAQAFRQAILAVESLREQLHSLRAEQAEARRRYWQQVGPVAGTVVAARRALYAPLENALLLPYFSRAEHRQLTEFILGNARALQDRFGEDEAEVLQRYGSASAGQPETRQETPAPEPVDPHLLPHEQAAAQARARRKSKAQKAQEAAEQAAYQEQQRLLSNTKSVYRQLARANHPDLERDPALQQQKTARMQRITEAYEANDLYTLLQLLAETGPNDTDTEEVLMSFTKALQQQQTELKLQLQALKYGPNGFAGSTGKKQEAELRQLKRHLRAEADYLQHVAQLMREPEGIREVLRTLAAEGHETI